MSRPLRWSTVALAGLLTFLAACRSPHLDITVENQTGAPIRLLEVDYPNASFGSDAIAAGGVLHYRIQVAGNGPVTLQYTSGEGRPVQNTGPTLARNDQGRLEILLLPAGKAEFHPGHR